MEYFTHSSLHLQRPFDFLIRIVEVSVKTLLLKENTLYEVGF